MLPMMLMSRQQVLTKSLDSSVPSIWERGPVTVCVPSVKKPTVFDALSICDNFLATGHF